MNYKSFEVKKSSEYRDGNFYPQHELIGKTLKGVYPAYTCQYGGLGALVDIECLMDNKTYNKGEIYRVFIPYQHLCGNFLK